jgi:transcriptional regulator with XRE-family HTH domain
MIIIREADFAKRVAACRKKLKLRQNNCAQLVGVSRQIFNNWETGLCKPKGQVMTQLASVLQCDVVWLQHGEGTELEQRIENVLLTMRIAIRDLEHIHRALCCVRQDNEAKNSNHRMMENIQ